MAISAGDLTNMRAATGHTVRPYLNVVPPVQIGTARVNQSVFTYPRNDVDVDAISLNGSLANLDAVPLNTMVWIGTSAGAHDVMVSALANRSATSSALFLHGFGKGDPGLNRYQPAALADNQYVTLLAPKPLWGYLSRIEAGSFYKRYDMAYVDEGSDPAPVCNLGPWRRVYLGASASVNLVLTNAAIAGVKPASFAWGSKTIAGYAWTTRNSSYLLNTGCSFVGSSASEEATIQFTVAGWYVVYCTVTDSAGKTHTGECWVRVIDETTADDLHGWRVTSDDQTREGRRMTIIMDGSVAESVVYPGAPFLYTEVQRYNGQVVTAGATVDTFVGFVNQEKGLRSVGYGRVEFELLSPAFILDQVSAAPQYIIEDASPASWVEVSSVLSNPSGVAWYVLQHHSPAMLQQFDFDPLAGASTNYRDNVWPLNGRSIWAQLREILPYQINAGCASEGGLLLRARPWLMSTSDRTALDTRVTWGAGDLRGDEPLEIPRKLRPDVGQLDAYAFSYDGTTTIPWWARAPGDAQGQGPDKQVVNGLVVPPATAQASLSALAGHLLAEANNPTPQLVLHVQRNLDTMDPARMVWHALTIAATLDPRGLGFSATRFVPEQVSRTWTQTEGGTWLKQIDAVAQIETAGQAGQAKPVPVQEDGGWYPDSSWPSFGDLPVYEPGADGVETTSPTLLICAHYASAKVARATVASVADTPVWEDVSTGLVGSVRWMTSDPFKYGRYFCVTTDGLYRAEDLPTAPVPLWVKVLGVENVRSGEQALGFHYVEMTGARQGLIIVVNYTRHYQISLDYGATWLLPTEAPSGAGNTRAYWGMVAVSPLATEANPVVWLRSPTQLRKSTNWGVTYAAATAAPLTEFGNGAINLPLFKQPGVPNDPAGLQTMYLSSAYNGDVVNPGRAINRTDDSTSTWATYILGTSTGAGNWAAWPAPAMRPLQSYTQDGRIVMAVQRSNGSPIALRTAMTMDAGVTSWATASAPTALTNLDMANVNGWPYDPNTWISWGVRDISGPDGGYMAATNDAGTTWHDLLGNLVSGGIFADGQIAYAEFSLAAVQ